MKIKSKITVIIGLVAILFISISMDSINSLVGEWELEQFVVKDRTIYYRGVPDSCYNNFRNIEFENQAQKEKAVLELYKTMSTDKLEFKPDKARSSFNNDKKGIIWWKYKVVNDTILGEMNGTNRKIAFQLNDNQTRLTLNEDFVHTVWKKVR